MIPAQWAANSLHPVSSGSATGVVMARSKTVNSIAPRWLELLVEQLFFRDQCFAPRRRVKAEPELLRPPESIQRSISPLASFCSIVFPEREFPIRTHDARKTVVFFCGGLSVRAR